MPTPEGGSDAEPAGSPQRFAGIPDEAVRAIAALFQTEATLEPYCESVDKPIYRVTHRAETGTLTLVLWPALDRVDVACGPHRWVAKAIETTEVYDGLEALFRLRDGGLLFVALKGDVLLVTGRRDTVD